MTKRQTELMRLASEVEAGDEGTAWRDRLEAWLEEKAIVVCNHGWGIIRIPPSSYGAKHIGRWATT